MMISPDPGAETPRRTARIAGAFYLLVIVTGIFSVFARSGLIVRGDAAATAAHILTSQALYRAAFAADLVGTGCYLVVTALLYRLLAPVNRDVARIAAFFSIAGCAVGAVNQANLLSPFVLFSGMPYLAVFTPQQLEALAYTALRMHGEGLDIGLAFFGVYCLLTGWLVLRSRFLPRAIGYLLVIAGIGWLTGSFASFLYPPLANLLSIYIMLPGLIGESALTLWLLAKGVDEAKWREAANEAG